MKKFKYTTVLPVLHIECLTAVGFKEWIIEIMTQRVKMSPPPSGQLIYDDTCKANNG